MNTYSMGLTEMLDNTNVLSAITKFEKGEELSPDEQHLLDAVAINMSAQAVAGDPDLGHLMGSAFVESIPFMVEMMMNPISGAGEGLGKAMTKYALKRFGKEAGSKALEKGAKIAGRVAGDAMAATGMSATSGIIGVAADATARMTGAPVYTNDFGEVSFGDVARDENGEMILDGNGKPVPVGSVGKESEGKALYKAFTCRSIENFSEMFGEYFGMAGKTLMNTTLGKKISSSALIRSMDAFTTADWTKQFNQILKDGKYNGFIGETAEEYVGGLLNAAFVGDQSFEDLASTDNLVQTVAAVGLMSGIFGSVNLAGIRLTRYKARKDLEKSEKEAYNLLGEDFDVLRDNISSLDPDAQEDAVKNVLASPDLDRDQKEAVLDYFHKQSYYNGLKFGENKRIEEAVQAETEAVRAESNPGTGMYIEASRIDPLSGERIPGTIEQGTIDDERVIWKGPDGKKQMIPKTEIDRSTVRSAPIQEVIDASVEAIREAEQGQISRDSKYSPEILSPEETLGQVFYVDGNPHIFKYENGKLRAYLVDINGQPIKPVNNVSVDDYYAAKQEELDYEESSKNAPLYKLPDGRIARLIARDEEEVAVEILDRDGVVIDNFSMPKEKFDEEASAVEPQEQSPNADNGLTEELGVQQTAGDNYSRFVDTGEVSDERVNDIASKIIRGEPLNPEEESIRAGVAQRVENKLKEASNPINTSQITTENAIASPNEESNMSQNPAASEESAADVPDQDASTAIPADENGNLLYHQAPVEATLSDILDGSLDSDEIDAFVGENKKAASALLKKVSEKPPKMSTNKAKYLDQKKAWSDRVAEAEQQVSYWNDVESILKESRMKPGDKAAEEIKSMGEPVTGEELAAMMLANGSIKLTKESYKRETGAGEEEAKKMFGLFATPQNGGVSIERAGELVMLADLENGTNHFDQEDPNAGRNAIIEVLSSARTRGDLIDYVKNNREAMAERERQAEYNAYAEWCEEMFHMSLEEYDAYEELVMNDIVSRHLDEASYNELMSIFATEQNINEDDKKHDAEQSGAGEARQGSREILPREESVPTERVGRTEEGPESVDGSLDNENGVTYESASGEIDENGKLFVLSSDGTTTFGVIPQETGLTPAPIKLSEGFQNEENKGYGLRHIESNHGEQILEAGFPSIENFVETVSKGFTVIKKGNQRGDNDTYLLEVKDKHNNTLFVELSKDGSYWNVNSAGIFNERYSKKKDIVWTLPAVSSSTNADATGVNHGTTKGETVASGNSPQTISSEDKYNDISSQKQADDKKIFVSPERADDESLLDYAERITEAHKFFEEKPQTDHSLKENTNVGSEMLQKAPYTPIKPIGVGPFGPIYDQFRGKVKEAFDFLLDRKDGDLLGVFHRDDVGDIDLVWGEAKTKYTGKGLAHIIKKHIDTLHDFSSIDDAISTIDNVIKNGNIAYNGNNLEIGNNGYKVVIAQTDDKKWILTAFDNTKTKKEKLSSAITPGTPNGINGNRAVVPGDNLSRENKDNDISPENQTEKAKPFVSPERKEGENLLDYAERVTEAHKLFEEEQKVDTNPSEAQKEAGNYKKGHIKVDGFDITIEQPAGSVRSGKDADGKEWSVVMNNTYGYIRGTRGVDGDHIDIFLSDDPSQGNIFIVDQIRPDGSFDEHKVMYGFPSINTAREAYLANYNEGWKGLGGITEVTKDDFKKWIESSIRKTKPFAEYKIAKEAVRSERTSAREDAPTLSEEKPNPSQNRLVSDERYAELKRRMREKLGGQMNIGVDPEILAIGTEMAVYHIEKGAHKFAAYAKAMISDLGDSIRPYLKAFYNGARELPEMEVLSREMDNYEDVRRFDVTNFDKPSTDILAMAEIISREQEVADLKKQLEEKAKASDGKKSGSGGENTISEGDVRYRSIEREEQSELDNVNERFNEELRQQIEGVLPKDHIYQLGTPSEFLLSAGIPNLPIQLPASQLAYKATSGKHDYDLSEVVNLPKAIANPIASFSYGDKGKSQNILTMLEHEGENFLVGMFIRPTIKGRILEVNSIRNVFPKNSESIVKWIEQGKLTNANKKKLLNFLDQQRTNHADVAFVLPDEQVKQVNSETSITKIVKNFKNPTLEQGEIVSEIDDLSSKLHTPVTIINDVNEITDTNEKTQLRKRSSKGWYDLQTKEIVIVLPNNKGVADAQRTFLHEVVAHHGLRKLFGDDFDTFLSNVYANANEGIRREILRRTEGNPLRLHEATEEYLADLAERGFDNKEERSLWNKIKDAFIDMLRKMGVDLGFKLSDDDLRYILWRSYRNLEEGNLLDLAEDVSMRNKLGIGEYGVRNNKAAPDILYKNSDLSSDDGGKKYHKKKTRPAKDEKIIKELRERIERLGKNSEQIEDVKKDLVNEIKNRIDSKDASHLNKRDLMSLLRQVRDVKTKEDMAGKLMEVERISYEIRIRSTQRDIDKSLALKIQDVNGKNMSIAKNVDDSTRRIFQFMRGRLSDLKASGYEQDMTDLRRRNRELRELIDANKRKSLYGDLSESESQSLRNEISSYEQEIEANKSRLSELKEMADEIRNAKAEGTEADLDEMIDELKAKMSTAASGSAIWKREDSERLTALNIIKNSLESRKYDRAAENTLSEIEAKLRNNSQLYRNMSGKGAVDKGDAKKRRSRAKEIIAENKRQILCFRRLYNEIRRSQLDVLKSTQEQLTELINGGKDALRKMTEEEIERGRSIIRNSLDDVIDKPVDINNMKADEMNFLKKFFSAPLGSFDYMAQRIGRKFFNGEGYIYQYFVKGENGTIACENTYAKGIRHFRDTFEAKTKEIFGKDAETVLYESDKKIKNTGIYMIDTNPGGTYGQKVEKELTRGEAMYLYMVWKMNDGRMKLEKQGLDDDAMQEIEDFIGPQYRKLADWIQEDLLVNLRGKYNERYLEMYDTQMADIPNYVPLRINRNAVFQESNLEDNKRREKSLEERTRSLIKRTVNDKPVDLTTNGIGVIFEHVKEMEEWYAFTRVRRDLDYVLGNIEFRNRVNANAHGHFSNFKDAAILASHSHLPSDPGISDTFWSKLSKGVIGGNIAFRLNTAIKQLLSLPAFLGYSQSPKFMAYFAKNIGLGLAESTSLGKMKGTYQWCIENMPLFYARVKEGDAGNEKLQNKGFSKGIDKYLKSGMVPNKFIDAFTVAIGAKTVYEYTYDRLTNGPDKIAAEEARRQALVDADIFFNQSQQSGMDTFLSPMQRSRSMLDIAFTTYQNSNIGYVRKVMLNFYDLVKLKDWNKLRGNYVEKYISEGIEKNKAYDMATGKLLNDSRKQLFGLMLFGWGMNMLWDWGSRGLMGFFTGDDDENDMYKDIVKYLTSPIRGIPIGNIVSNLVDGYDINPVIFMDEVVHAWKSITTSYDDNGIDPLLAIDVLSSGSKLSGFDLEMWGNIYLGIEGAVRHLGREGYEMQDLLFFLNTPKSQRVKVAHEMYKDSSLLDFAEKVSRAYRYTPLSDKWEYWVPGTERMTHSKMNKIKREYQEIMITDKQKEKLKKRKELEKKWHRAKDLSIDPEAMRRYLDSH